MKYERFLLATILLLGTIALSGAAEIPPPWRTVAEQQDFRISKPPENWKLNSWK